MTITASLNFSMEDLQAIVDEIIESRGGNDALRLATDDEPAVAYPSFNVYDLKDYLETHFPDARSIALDDMGVEMTIDDTSIGAYGSLDGSTENMVYILDIDSEM